MASAIGLVDIVRTKTNGAVDHYSSTSNARVLLETKFFDLDGYTQLQNPIGNLEKTLSGVVLELGQGNLSSVNLFVGVKQRLKDDAIWYGPFSLEEGDEMIHTLGVEDARFFAFRIVDESPVSVWQISAMELYGLVGEGQV